MPINPAVIDAANPYTTQPGATPPVFVNPPVVEQQLEVGIWRFKGVPYYIEKAIKVPYTYMDANGVHITEYLLIGYAGGGAY